MVSTSLIVAVSALGAAPSPAWQADYGTARSVAAAQNKPVAVFIGSGKADRLVAEGAIPAEAARLLRESYVCVHLDTETGAGKELAGRFQLAEGLVISAPGGDLQALRHAGTVSGTDLTRQLGQFAAAGRPLTTVSTGAVVTANYTPAVNHAPVMTASYSPVMTYAPAVVYGGCSGGSCRVAAPVMSYGYQPAPAYTFVGSSCANGQCNVRR